MKIYIAGKITGDASYYAKFIIAQREIQDAGHAVLNPAHLPEGMSKSDYMRICFAMIDVADEVWTLPDCDMSEGALLEIQYCNYIGKPVRAIALRTELKEENSGTTDVL